MNNGIKQEDDGGGSVPKEENITSLGTGTAIKVEIKQENELIIEDHHQQQEQGPLCSPKIEQEEDESQQQHCSEYEHNGYSIKFLEDCDDSQDIDYFNDDSVDHDSGVFNGDKEDEIDSKNRQYSEFYEKIIDLQNRNYVFTICPFCDQLTKSFTIWTRHIAYKHPKLSEDIRNHFGEVVYSRAECKLCSEKIYRNTNRLLHYFTKHTQTKALFGCQLCKERYLSASDIVKHLDDKHGQFNDPYRQCPLCCEICSDREMLRKHFQELHQVEFMEKFNFVCHLCRHPRFEKLEQLYGHLINLHQLSGSEWEASHFNAFDNLKYQCLTCGENCEKSGPYTLLNHHLKHKDDSIWFCKFCLKNFKFTETTHLCIKMYKHFRKDTGEEVENSPSLQGPSRHLVVGKSRIVSKQNEGDWNSFESYVQLCCPFCNHGFEQFQEWQVHLREKHFTNTLKGLNMKQGANTIQKLQCIICNTFVVADCGLYAHCFQHLPYKPFKCRHCNESLENYKMAFQHFRNKCNENNVSLDDFEDIMLIKMASEATNSIVILCSLCKGQQFSTPEEIETHFEELHNNFEHNYKTKENTSGMVCKVCDNIVEATTKHVFLSHYKEHLSEGPYKCVFCQRSYTAYEKCRIHVNRYHMGHVKPQTIVQSLHQINKTPSKATQQLSTKPSVSNGLGVSPYKATIFNEFSEFLTFACPECNDPFPTLNAWNDHINANHTFFEESNLNVLDKEKGKLTCPECNIVLCTSISQQQKHKMTHMPYKAFGCTLCDSRFTTTGLLYKHLRRMHFAMGNFPCPVCTAKLNNAYERSVHVKKTHPRSEWPQNMCLKCYRNYRNLNAHMLTHDTDRPKYFCPICDVGIVVMPEMRTHMERIHNQIVGKDFKLERKRQSEREQSPHIEKPIKTQEKKPKREDISKL